MKLVFATNNQNKVKEVQSLLPNHITILSLIDIGCEEDIPETQPTIEGNAIQKAQYVKKHYGYDCFADDTGLEVNALNGEPGVFSARYAGEQRNSDDNMNKLLNELQDKKDRSAHFKTVVALILNGEQHTFSGICKGTIIKEKKGEKGFGYDPIFMANGFEETFAQISLEEKNRVGHRGKAVQKLIDFLNTKK
ncbi:Non-canonical purine NTP pyrophosphatase [Kordia antarctica]|uniref:dITP/XTP pyrophosphatase n=1 Tax=Kordia antarctica TaxID=1218801 RepID=A0A7L4ZFK6_9FLAO|nr:non-canonical purine NTP diphosphatase [Kordia antarctica]QHI34744.1 Non-canonical purine NTP pyrophosphatase [Kordia antarctica]